MRWRESRGREGQTSREEQRTEIGRMVMDDGCSVYGQREGEREGEGERERETVREGERERGREGGREGERGGKKETFGKKNILWKCRQNVWLTLPGDTKLREKT